jgi:hypothetical protein
MCIRVHGRAFLSGEQPWRCRERPNTPPHALSHKTTRPIFTGVSLLAAETNSLRWMQVERVHSKLQKTLSKIRNRLKRSLKEKLMEKQHPRQNTWGQTPQQQCSRSIVKKQRR